MTRSRKGAELLTAYESGSLSFKNRIINGAMTLDQRNAGASVNPTDAQYTVDRWTFGVSQTSKLTAQQNAGAVTPPAGFTNYLGATSSSAYSVGSNDYFLCRQNIEGFNTADLNWGTANAKTVTLSFLVRSSLIGTFGGSIQNNDSSRAYPFSYSIPVANAWTQISITIPGDTTGTWTGANNGIGIRVSFGLGVGTAYSGTSGSWQSGVYLSATGATSVVGTSGATFYITGVQLEKGSTATSFEFRDYGRELLMCQRYFWKCQTSTYAYPIAATANTNFRLITIPNPVWMRTGPSVSGISVGGTTTPQPDSVGAGIDRLQFQWNSLGGGDFVNVGSYSVSAEL